MARVRAYVHHGLNGSSYGPNGSSSSVVARRMAPEGSSTGRRSSGASNRWFGDARLAGHLFLSKNRPPNAPAARKERHGLLPNGSASAGPLPQVLFANSFFRLSNQARTVMLVSSAAGARFSPRPRQRRPASHTTSAAPPAVRNPGRDLGPPDRPASREHDRG
jgi:hypothetical protein